MEELINGRTPEEIKLALRCCRSPMGFSCKECPYNGTCLEHEPEFDALDLIEHLEAKQPKWISVKERLPKDGELVLITMNGEIDGYKQFDHAYELANYWSEGEDEDGEYHAAGWVLWDYGEGRVSDIEVFYWMPLPEPPEEEAYGQTDAEP